MKDLVAKGTQWVGYGGGDLEIKNIQNKFIFFVLFHVEDIEDTVYGM